mmetsp:Transcript_22410/g.42278  ORF Transcript_22410/g.42278 Transcript_22410/m.42278 type:complete len:186 (+) Transcript_22410:72-629(+)
MTRDCAAQCEERHVTETPTLPILRSPKPAVRRSEQGSARDAPKRRVSFDHEKFCEVIQFVPSSPKRVEVDSNAGNDHYDYNAKLTESHGRMWEAISIVIAKIMGSEHHKEIPPCFTQALDVPDLVVESNDSRKRGSKADLKRSSFTSDQEALAHLHLVRLVENHEKVMTNLTHCLSAVMRGPRWP